MSRPEEVVRYEARVISGGPRDMDCVLAAVGDRRFALLGEASHGTHEFYSLRAEITRRLIAEKGFRGVAIEGDWPSAERVDRFVRGDGRIADAEDALEEFRRFPTWMWRNADVLDFVGWLRELNDARGTDDRVGFYGLDLYSLHESIEAVLAYLDRTDPEAALRARRRYACFERFDGDAQAYGYGAASGLAESCEDEVVQQLVDLRRNTLARSLRTDRTAHADFFRAEQNARLVQNAEEYYREMFRGGASSWNLRDRHMTETLEALADFLETPDRPSKIVVWAHNSHLGDARATQMGQAGELNVGQLVRERHGSSAFSLGFTTHHGTVTAASEWDAPAERKRVRPARGGSYEALFHDSGVERFFLPLSRESGSATALRGPRLERAIGVIYRPETERQSHYFLARLSEQFDGVIHCDASRAVEPLERYAPVPEHELPETYPSGM